MKKLLQLSTLAVLAVAGAFVLTSVNPSLAVAQENEQPVDESAEQQAEETEEAVDTEEEAADTYSFTAQPGDSYAKIARKSVQIYGIVNNTNLSQAQIVAAETFLSSEAGFPVLAVGETVTLSESAVRAAVEKAQGLDEAAVALWQRYVPYVDFNTDNVGEARS